MVEEWEPGYRNQGKLRISTRGRRTAKKHTVTVWFVTDGERLFVSSPDGDRDWVSNVLKDPSVEVSIGNTTRKMTAQLVLSDVEKDRIRKSYRRKYLLSRVYYILASLVGISRETGIVFELKSKNQVHPQPRPPEE